MAFFRIKKIKGNSYAYRVENEWKRKGSRQKVKGYLGRAYRFDIKKGIGFPEFLKIEKIEDYLSSNGLNKIINDLVEWELSRFEVDKRQFLVDLSNKRIQRDGKTAVLVINDGFMCESTLKNLLDFRPEDEETDGYRFARAFVEAGIKVPQEVFVALYQKMLSKIPKNSEVV